MLVGSEFWDDLIGWMRRRLLGDGLVDSEDLKLMHVLDSPEEVCEIFADLHDGHERAAGQR